MIKPITAVVACFAITGCSVLSIGESEYSCKGYDTEGVTCMSAREVYQATENASAIRNSDFQGTGRERGEIQERAAQREPAAQGRIADQGAARIHPTGQYVQHTGPTPIRTQARVMRVWIDTYEDQEGDLHSPGLVYTEVESRRWNIGQSTPQRADRVTPLGVRSSTVTPTPEPSRQPTTTPSR